MDLAYMLADDIDFERQELGEAKHKEIRLNEQAIMVGSPLRLACFFILRTIFLVRPCISSLALPCHPGSH
jgi:hypothetical protein